MKNSGLFMKLHLQLFILLMLLIIPVLEIKAQFAKGADIGWLSQMEAAKYVFKNNSGIQKNCMDILKEKGINALRFRVWVNPKDGYCGKKDVAYMVHRADSMGFKVMLDFHLSDTWADPGTQTKPAAWANHTINQLTTDVYNHVYEVLDTLKKIGVVPTWVQIGNETNDGVLWEEGRASKNMKNFASIIKSGYDAVKAIDNSIQVIVHLSNGYDDTLYRWMFKGLSDNGAKWDIIGMSVYPSYSKYSWAECNRLALITMQDMIALYNTKVMVVETGYPNNQAAEAKSFLLDLIKKTKSVGGLGVFYWEPESYNWQGYLLGAWDPITRQPTIAMDAFVDSTANNVISEKTIPDNYDIKNYPNPFNPSTTIQYSISKGSNVSIRIYDSLGRLVKSLVNEYNAPGKYSTKWSGVDDSDRQCSSGIYFINLQADTEHQFRKMVLLK